MTTLVGAGTGTPTLTKDKLDPKRNATAEDVAILGGVWRQLNNLRADLREAQGNLAKGLAVFSEADDHQGLIAEVERVSAIWAASMLNARVALSHLPVGTTAKGGATVQSVVMEFFAPVNRELKARMTASQAKALNKAAFSR